METPPVDAALVFAPSVTLTITVEGEAPGAEVHLHAGGQGFWIAQLMAELGARVCMASPFGGEPGAMLRAAIEEAGIGVRAVDMAGANGVSIHDRRDGDLEEIVDVPAKPLTRHEVDELYGAALVEALGTRVCVLAGAAEPPVAAANLYERLTRDLRGNGRCVVADVCGAYLQAVVAGGVSVLKVSVEQLQGDGLIDDDSDAAVVQCAEELRAVGAEGV